MWDGWGYYESSYSFRWGGRMSSWGNKEVRFGFLGF